MPRLAMARGWHHDPLRHLARLTRLYHMRAHAMIVSSMPAMTALGHNALRRFFFIRLVHCTHTVHLGTPTPSALLPSSCVSPCSQRLSCCCRTRQPRVEPVRQLGCCPVRRGLQFSRQDKINWTSPWPQHIRTCWPVACGRHQEPSSYVLPISLPLRPTVFSP
jgi:hypothetical protein